VTPKDADAARLPLQLNPSLGMPIYRQIVDGIRRMIAGGVLKPGDQLPSIRDLSSQLRINPSSAVKAYEELKHAGVITLDHGRGTFVADDRLARARDREAMVDQELDRLVQAARSMGLNLDDVINRLKIRFKRTQEGRS